MKIAVVTAFPPSKVTLNEYGYHLVKNFVQKEEVSELVLMSDKTKAPKQLDFENSDKITVNECWSFNSYGNILSINKAIQEEKPDAIAAIESRGFWFGTLLAQKLNVPFIPLRKKGKLPGATESIHYDLEYGTATIEIHTGHVKKGWNIMVHDDLLATGGTAIAAAKLLEGQGAKIHSFSFLVNLTFLGAEKLIPLFPIQEFPSVLRFSINF